MTLLSQSLSETHRQCDTLFAAMENAVTQQKWGDASSVFNEFRQATEDHFQAEENILFPAFEKATGMTQGPTRLMRREHQQMRDALSRMAGAIATRDADASLGCADTLLMLMQQHNLKEEQMLYRMMDEVLESEADALLARIKTMAV